MAKKESVLELLETEQIVSFELKVMAGEPYIAVTEMCDLWYGTSLDKSQMEQLIAELTELKDKL